MANDKSKVSIHTAVRLAAFSLLTGVALVVGALILLGLDEPRMDYGKQQQAIFRQLGRLVEAQMQDSSK